MSSLQEKDLAKLSDLMSALEAAKKDKAEKEVIVLKLMEFFRETGLKSYKTDSLIIRFVDTRETSQFDPELLQEKYPEIWKECHATKQRPPHISIKKK